MITVRSYRDRRSARLDSALLESEGIAAAPAEAEDGREFVLEVDDAVAGRAAAFVASYHSLEDGDGTGEE